MSTQQKETQTNETQTGLKRPFMLAYAVRPFGDGQNSAWSKIGAAWAHKDGQGFELRMDALPVDGRIVLRNNKESGEDQTGDVIERTHE